MAYFDSAQDVYDTIGDLFNQIADDDDLAPKFRRANLIVQHRYHEPDATITVRMREDEPNQIDFGESEMEPDVTLSMEADTAHRFWLGRVNIPTALARGQIKASGPVAKVLKLVPLTSPAFPRYKALLESRGRDDLANPA